MRIPIAWAMALGLAAGGGLSAQQPPPERKVRNLAPKSLATVHFAISARLPVKGLDQFGQSAEALHAAWTERLGAAAHPKEKFKVDIHVDRGEYRKQISGTAQADLVLLWDRHVFRNFALRATDLYLATAYPKFWARKDVPPWIAAGLRDYFGGARWKDGRLDLDAPQLPHVSQGLLAFQYLCKSGNWYPFEKALRAGDRDYENRRWIVNLEGWGALYHLFNAPAAGRPGTNAAVVKEMLCALENGQKIDAVLTLAQKKLGVNTLGGWEKAVRDYLGKIDVETPDREEKEWLVGETAHYVIHVEKGTENKKTKAKDKRILADLKFQMELLFDKYALAFGFQGRLLGKAVLRVHKDHASYLRGGGPPNSAAYYDSSTQELVGYEDSEEQGMLFQTLCHEGCHQFFDLAFPGFYESDDLPMWFSEGLADCFGTAELRGKDLYVFTLAGSAAWRLDTLKYASEAGRPALKDLVGMGRLPFMSNAGIHYAISWSFVHFLWNHPTPEAGKGVYREVVIRLIDGFKNGRPKDEVYKDAFQLQGKPLDFDQLEKEWKIYVRTLRSRK